MVGGGWLIWAGRRVHSLYLQRVRVVLRSFSKGLSARVGRIVSRYRAARLLRALRKPPSKWRVALMRRERGGALVLSDLQESRRRILERLGGGPNKKGEFIKRTFL